MGVAVVNHHRQRKPCSHSGSSVWPFSQRGTGSVTRELHGELQTAAHLLWPPLQDHVGVQVIHFCVEARGVCVVWGVHTTLAPLLSADTGGLVL